MFETNVYANTLATGMLMCPSVLIATLLAMEEAGESSMSQYATMHMAFLDALDASDGLENYYEAKVRANHERVSAQPVIKYTVEKDQTMAERATELHMAAEDYAVGCKFESL